jgi:hypothetical protein
MIYAIKKQQKLDPSLCKKTPLTQLLNHIEMEMQQQMEEPELGGSTFVSHIPVSIGCEAHSSSSTLSSSSWKEGSENEDIMSISTSTRPFTENNKTSELDTISTRIVPIYLSQPEKIRATLNTNKKTSNTKKKSSIKSSVISADDASDDSPRSSSSKLGNRSSPLSSLIITRPAKKPRTISNEYTNPADFTTNDISSVITTRSVSPQSQQHHSSLLLLAQDEDEEHLSPLHVFVRKQIEVFTATATELAQPAPGRKQPIQLHQVGLRCIHCRSLLSDGVKKARVKRAVCYPSAVGRIYHSVSDMKFDHFTHCKELPSEVRKTFKALKTGGKSAERERQGKSGKGNSSSSTAKYYRDSASRMGLADSPGGIIYMNTAHARATQNRTMNPNMISGTDTAPNMSPQLRLAPSTAMDFLKQHQQEEYRNLLLHQQSLTVGNTAAVASMLFPPMQISRILAANSNNENISSDLKYLTNAMNSGILQSLLMNAIAAGANAQKSIDTAIALAKEQRKINSQHPGQNSFKRPHEDSRHTHVTAPAPRTRADSIIVPLGKITVSLAAADDAEVLNPLHCFVRKHVELFSADEDDIAAPCPGRKTRVMLGQVGIRCKHCAKIKLPPKERVKRAVCYPPSIDGIYHSVSNMKFDHFGICPGLSPVAKEELAALRSSCSGRRQASAGNKTSGNKSSTGFVGTNMAQYYRDAAFAKGLVDTYKGIRFCSPCRQIPSATTVRTSPQQSASSFASVSATSAIPVAQPPVAKNDIPQFPTGISALMMAASHATSI